MIFFDDEMRNLDDLSPLGVTCIKVDPEVGMNINYLRMGLEQFEANNK